MKKFTVILLVMLLCVSFAFAKTEDIDFQFSERIENQTRPGETRVFEPTIYSTFEGANALEGWETGDTRFVDPGEIESEYWKLINNVTIAYPDTPNFTWFPGDLSYGTNGGYESGRLLYLQSPSITLPASPAPLTFKFKQALEILGGGTIGGVTYDGWDGWNVRISTDGGTSWSVITPTSPVYNSVNMYGFGYNGDSPLPMPGWGGLVSDLTNPTLDANGWVTATFNLTAYANQTVLIRWVLGTDPAFDTVTPPPDGNPSLFGVVVIDININGTAYNFTSATDFQGFSVGHIVQSFPDLWQVRTNFQYASSPTSVITCGEPDANGVWSYLPEMDNYIVTPWITLPSDGAIMVDFKYTNFPASQAGSDTNWDGIAFDVYHDLDGTYRWYGMGDPYVFNTRRQFYSNSDNVVDGEMDYLCNPNGEYGWTNLMNKTLTLLAGRQVKFRVVMLSQMFPTVPNRAIKIDDLTIFFEQHLNPPSNLTADIVNDEVVLNWVNPVTANATLQNIIVESKPDAGANYTVVATITDPSLTTYTHANPQIGEPIKYRLRATYDLGATVEGSNEVLVIIPSATQRMLIFDNGIASALAPASSGLFANRVDISLLPPNWDSFWVKYIQVYINESGGSVSNVRLWRESDGMPGAQAVSQNSGLQSLPAGWYIISIPVSNSSHFERESFYVGFHAAQSGSPKIGISEVEGATVAWSSNTLGTTWAPYTSGNFMIRALVEVDISDADIIQPEPNVLYARNYPNPFNPETTIHFNIPTKGKTTVEVFNIKGQLVKTLLNDSVNAGEHRVTWSGLDNNGASVTSGVYFYRVQTESDSLVNKMILLK